MPSHRFFALGDHNATCDICGRAFKFSRLQKTWDGFWACDQDWYPRNPQEYLRGIADNQSVAVNRPQVFSFVNTPVGNISALGDPYLGEYTLGGL